LWLSRSRVFFVGDDDLLALSALQTRPAAGK